MRNSRGRVFSGGVFLIGLGSVLVTVFAAAMIYLGLLEKFGVSDELFSRVGLLAACLVSFVWVLRAGLIAVNDCCPNAPYADLSPSPSAAIFLLALCLPLAAKLFIFQGVPVVAWDSLDYWAPEAVSFIASFQSLSKDFSSSYLHPYFSYMSLPALTLTSEYDSSVRLHGMVPVLLSGLLIIGLCLQAGSSRSIWPAILALFIFISLALVENHTLLVGYVDMWMASATLFGACWVYLALRTRAVSAFVLAAFYCLSIIWWRNDWPVYLAPLILATLTSTMFGRRKVAVGAVITLLLLSALIAWSASAAVIVDLTRFDLGHYGFDDSGDSMLLWMGKRSVGLSFQNLSAASTAFMDALFYNSSFSTLLLASLVSISTLCVRGFARELEIVFLVTLPFFTLMVFALASVLSNHFLEAYTSGGTTGGDVGLSRFLLSWSIQAMLAVGVISQLRSVLWQKDV